MKSAENSIWHEKISRLQRDRKLSAEDLAGALGITTRTLSEFVRLGGRPPTEPVQRLIDLLLGDLASEDLARQPRLNLVIIHGDFRVAGGEHPVDSVRRITSMGSHTNEFHYITVEPERDAKFALEALTTSRVLPHLFLRSAGPDTVEARDCFFAVTATWLVAQAKRRDLAHITLAADTKKFWPLARGLKELAEVGVSIVRGDVPEEDRETEKPLLDSGIVFVDPAGRRFGRVEKLKQDATKTKIAYGFIQPVTFGPNGDSRDKGELLFFSFNHMRREKSTGDFEVRISDLVEGDIVSFGAGLNYQGPCAADVALVKRPERAPDVSVASTRAKAPSNDRLKDEDLIELQVAVTDCADREGWAYLAQVGTRLTSMRHEHRVAGFKNLADFVAAHPEIFELSDPDNSKLRPSLRVRLRPAKR